MWSPTARRRYSRAGLRYGSDLADPVWTLPAPFLPSESGCGRKRARPMREIVNAICYILCGGVAWRFLPVEFLPWRAVYRRFARFRDDGTWETINHHLVMWDRERVSREGSPTAVVIERLVANARALMAEGIGFPAICSNGPATYPADSFEAMQRFAQAHAFRSLSPRQG